MIAASSPDRRGQGRAQANQVFGYAGVQVFRTVKDRLILPTLNAGTPERRNACPDGFGRFQGPPAGKDGQAAAGKEWTSDWKFQKEAAEPEHRLVLGGTRTVAELFEEAPRDDEQGEGWATDEPSRAGRYARRLWDGLRAREELIDR